MSNEQTTPMPVPPTYPEKKKSRWWIPVLIVGVLIVGFFGFIVVVIVSISSSVGSFTTKKEVNVKENSVLFLPLSGTIDEYASASGNILESISNSKKANFLETLQAIKQAKKDPSIKGMYLKPVGVALGGAKLIELMDVIKDFKSSGKFIYTYIDQASKSDYLLASLADSVFTTEEAMFDITDYSITAMFMKNLTEKLNVDVTVFQFEEYKGAGESFSRTGFSPETRTAYLPILQQRKDAFISWVSQNRNLSKDAVNAILQKGIYTADSMKAFGLVDAMATELQVREKMRIRSTGDTAKTEDKKKSLRLVNISRYVESPNYAKNYDSKQEDESQIAIIFGVGGIQTGKSESNPLSGGEQVISSDEMVKDIRKARENKKVKAIILRVDSPGGSVLASDIIWNEIMETRKVKPVYASMSDVAASGGYYISMACDTILAHSNTITGSIGVIGIIPNFHRAMNSVGVTVDTISVGASKSFFNVMMPMTEQDKQRITSIMQPIYTRFVSKVAQSRGKTYEQAREVAKGRVWTGADAKNAGLVDVNGGLFDAIALAKKRIGVGDDKKVSIVTYPEKEDDIEVILKALGINKDEDSESSSTSSSIFQQNTMNDMPFAFALKLLPADVASSAKQLLQILGISLKEPIMVASPMFNPYM